MREIKFRGKSIETGEWIYGNLIGTDVIVGGIVEWDSEYFCTEFWVKVDPETVGQFTGLQDRNGKDIYEGDQLFAYGNLDENHEEYVGHAEWDADDARFEVVSFHGRFEYIPDGCFVKGSIHENPELLEAAE